MGGLVDLIRRGNSALYFRCFETISFCLALAPRAINQAIESGPCLAVVRQKHMSVSRIFYTGGQTTRLLPPLAHTTSGGAAFEHFFRKRGRGRRGARTSIFCPGMLDSDWFGYMKSRRYDRRSQGRRKLEAVWSS